MLFALQAAQGGPESVDLAGRASLGLGEEARGTTVGRDEPGASESGGVSLLLSLRKRAACCPPREAGCSLAQTRRNGAAAESSSSSQSQAQGWHKPAERVTLPVSHHGDEEPCAGLSERVFSSPGRRRHGGGGGGQAGFPRLGWSLERGNVRRVIAVVGNGLRLEGCAAGRGVACLSACLPAQLLPDFGVFACAGSIPVPRSQPGTRWDALVVTPCNWGLWRSGRAEGTFPCALRN